MQAQGVTSLEVTADRVKFYERNLVASRNLGVIERLRHLVEERRLTLVLASHDGEYVPCFSSSVSSVPFPSGR
jgi:hypothetical protein